MTSGELDARRADGDQEREADIVCKLRFLSLQRVASGKLLEPRGRGASHLQTQPVQEAAVNCPLTHATRAFSLPKMESTTGLTMGPIPGVATSLFASSVSLAMGTLSKELMVDLALSGRPAI